MNNINKILNDIEESLLKAESSYQLWWGLVHHGMSSHKNAIDDLHYVDFFHASIPCFLQCTFINLSKIFDRGRDLSGIKMLKNELTKLDHKNLVEFIEKKLLDHDIAVRSIKGIRDQSVAHSKYLKTTDQVCEENLLTPDQMKELIDIVKEILIKVSKGLNRKPKILESIRYCNATVSLLKALEKNRSTP